LGHCRNIQLYCAFAAWHFRMQWWFMLVIATPGIFVNAIALKQMVDRKNAWRRT
jgi:hypothetical protein